MKLRKILLLVFFGFLIFGGGYLVIYRLKSTDMQKLTSIALILTLFAVIWYAWETRRLRIETIRQTELSLRPFVIVSYNEQQRKFLFKNIGKGPALKVKIDDIPIIKEDGELYIRYDFYEIDVVTPKEEIEVNGEIKINEGTSGEFPVFMSHFFPDTAVKSYDFIINYTNINSEPYKTKGKFGKDRVVIKKTEKVT